MKRATKAVSDHAKQMHWERFQKAHPEVATWIEESTYSFPWARVLKSAVYKTGQLTPKQLASAEKCVINSAQHLLKKPDGIVPIQKFRLQLDQLARRGMKKPEINVGPFLFSPPDKRSPNRDFIYIFSGQEKTYLGKVSRVGELFVHSKFPKGQLAGVLAKLSNLAKQDTKRPAKQLASSSQPTTSRKPQPSAYRRETAQISSQADKGFAASGGKKETPAHARYADEPLGSRADFIKSNKTLSEEIRRRE